VNAAAAPFVRIVDKGTHQYETLAGWTGHDNVKALPEPVAAALSSTFRISGGHA
jgi:hypothetical protein